MPFGLSNKIFSLIITSLSKNPYIESAVLFGSRAKGTSKPGSDIDIALKGSMLTLNDIVQLQSIFDEYDQPYTFDIVIYHHISEPALVSHIDRLGVEIYKRRN